MAESGIFVFVQEYGYWVVFLFVFLQELGFPTPVPNELVLIFAGALTSIGNLSFWLMLLTAVAADIIGTTVLFSVFYFFEHLILEKIRKFEAVNRRLEIMKEKLVKQGRVGIFLGRLLPYLRAYVSIAAGILNLPYRVFVPLVALSAVIWSGGYVILGHFLGRQWETVAAFVEKYQWLLLFLIIPILMIFFGFKFRKKSKEG